MHKLIGFALLACIGIGSIHGCKSIEKLKTEYRTEIDSVVVAPFLLNSTTGYIDRFPTVFKDSTTINEIISTVSKRGAPAYACGYTGDITFYSKDSIVLKGQYNYHCNSIVLSRSGSNTYFRQRITDDGIGLYQALTEKTLDSLGQNWIDQYNTER